jgi:hypothetical protein
MGWTTEGSEFESRQIHEFSVVHVFHNGSVVHPVSYPIAGGVVSLSLRIKRPGLAVDHSSLTSAEVNKTCIYTSTPSRVFMT